VSLPYVSLGTGSGIHHPGVNVTDAVTMWLRAGGAAIDTAYDYGTQRLIAKGVAAAGPATTAPFLTTKVPSSSYEKAAAHIDADLSELGVAAVDLLLIHFPSLRMESTYDTWRALEDAYLRERRARSASPTFRPSTLRRCACASRASGRPP